MIVVKSSKLSTNQVIENLKSIWSAKGITLFTIIDHSGEAQKAEEALSRECGESKLKPKQHTMPDIFLY